MLIRAGLDGGVDLVDVFVGRRGDRRGAVSGGGVEPQVGDPGEVVVEGVGDHPIVVEVGVEASRVTVS